MKIYLNGQIDEHGKIFPDVTFPASGPSDEFLAERGAYKVSMFREYDSKTQKLVACAPVVEDGFAYVVQVANKTQDEIQSDTDAKASEMRAYRDEALKRCDWVVIRAYETNGSVDAEWLAYRQSLRDLPNSAGWPYVELPHSPDYVGPGGSA